MDKLELDQTTLNYVRHRLAGQLKNISSAVKMLKNGKTKLSSGEDIIEIIQRDIDSVREFMTEIKED